MSTFQSIRSFLHMLRLPKPDYEIYCREKRLERFEKYGGRIRHLRLHSFAHRILIPLMKAGLYLDGKRLTVLRDERRHTDRPVIYCPTHIGGVDIEMSFLAIHDPCWLALGDPRELYKSLDGFMLQLNGVIMMDVLEKEDRAAAKAQMKALLQAGGSLLLFPEGAQNVSPNKLLNHLYAGAVDLAISCKAEIVPIAIAREGDHYCFILGENISYNDCAYEDRFRLSADLRDTMATLLWEAIERLPMLKRSDITETAYDDFVREVLSLNTEYSWTVDDIELELFHPKGITEPAEAFAFLENLIPGRKNAFLFNKRPAGH